MNDILNSNPQKNLERNNRGIYNLTEKKKRNSKKIIRRNEKQENTFKIVQSN